MRPAVDTADESECAHPPPDDSRRLGADPAPPDGVRPAALLPRPAVDVDVDGRGLVPPVAVRVLVALLVVRVLAELRALVALVPPGDRGAPALDDDDRVAAGVAASNASLSKKPMTCPRVAAPILRGVRRTMDAQRGPRLCVTVRTVVGVCVTFRSQPRFRLDDRKAERYVGSRTTFPGREPRLTTLVSCRELS